MEVSTDRHSLYYEVHGTGPPVLLVHGFPLSGELWRPLVAALETEYRLIVPDLRGHGRSEASTALTLADLADDLAMVLDSAGATGPCVLVGMSMGGYVSFEFCRRHAERARAVVLASTRAQADDAEGVRARRELARRVERDGSAVAADTMAPRLFGPRASTELRARWREIMAATPPAGVVAALHAMAARPDYFATLAALTCPVLIVVGENDELTPPADANRMHDAAPDARIELIADAGHMVPVERPALFAAMVKRFLDDLPS